MKTENENWFIFFAMAFIAGILLVSAAPATQTVKPALPIAVQHGVYSSAESADAAIASFIRNGYIIKSVAGAEIYDPNHYDHFQHWIVVAEKY